MKQTVDYYFSSHSPWTYLGHARFAALAKASGAQIRLLPVDMGGKVFPASGGLPVGQRPAQRQSYRLLELKRFSEFLKMPLKLKPKYFPVNSDDAACLIIAVEMRDGVDAAMRLTQAVLTAVWARDSNVADPKVLAELLSECDLSPERLEQLDSQAARERYEANTQAAIAAGVFGAPSYCVDGEIFWGQDRLDFLERKLQTV
ncbi:MAG: 2-hydroxychromene-2-carboxylate isomerase [Burkholderiaceae bacterium]